MSVDIIVAGVGGQGSILASHILAEAAIMAGSQSPDGKKMNVRVGETFGAAMRGGAVASHVRFGSQVYGPLVGRGQADLVIAMEPLEGLRIGVEYIRKGGIVILNDEKIPPVDVKTGAVRYPEIGQIKTALEQLGASVTVVSGNSLAAQAGTPKALNIVMLGAAYRSGLLPFGEETLLQAIKRRVPSRFLDANLEAFRLGKESENA
ncbi:MAG: indolepyruvate oxidoreductase subunit beta [Spirochaetales bacterium]|nr:indolepyruvate oxidoreductase subunit beta [Spirochaetales bacterium]